MGSPQCRESANYISDIQPSDTESKRDLKHEQIKNKVAATGDLSNEE